MRIDFDRDPAKRRDSIAVFALGFCRPFFATRRRARPMARRVRLRPRSLPDRARFVLGLV